jgi:hypothetical protein
MRVSPIVSSRFQWAGKTLRHVDMVAPRHFEPARWLETHENRRRVLRVARDLVCSISGACFDIPPFNKAPPYEVHAFCESPGCRVEL